MKNSILILSVAVLQAFWGHSTKAQSITMHESYSYYYGTQGAYSCTPDPNTAISVNGAYTKSTSNLWIGGYNPESMGRPAYYGTQNYNGGLFNGYFRYLVNNNICVYCVSPLTIWWNGAGWVLGYEGQNGGSSYTNSIALFNGLNTAKPPCKGWGHGFLTGDCIDATVTVWTPTGAPVINAGEIACTGTVNNKNAYEMPVTNASAGAKVTIIWNGTMWVVSYSNPTGRISAETTLSTNSTDQGVNPPCTGWSNGYSFSGAICEGGAGGVLPVTLVSFKAKETPQKTIKLDWQTAQEQNSLFYGIERSKDMSSFEQIAKVQSAGTTKETSNYTLTDESPLKGRSYYRLRQVDLDGKETLYRAVSVRISGTDSPYPNPAKDGTMQIEATSNAVIKLTDLSGRNIDFVSKRINNDVLELTPKQRMPAGVYMILNNGVGYKIVIE